MSKFEANLALAEQHLRRFREQGVQNHIAGKNVAAGSGATFANTTPVDNSHLADVAKSDAADVDAAVKAAQEAFPAWRAMDGAKRRKILHQVADAIEARAEEISLVESMDTGQAIRFMAKAAVRGAENFRFFADKAVEAQDGKALRNATQLNYTSRRPIGPVAVITPWNTPFMLSTWKIAPALASGCTVVHKPAEFSPLTAKLLIEIAEAGRPTAGRSQSGQWSWRNGRQGADRASGYQGGCLRRGRAHRVDDHGAGCGDFEARPL